MGVILGIAHKTHARADRQPPCALSRPAPALFPRYRRCRYVSVAGERRCRRWVSSSAVRPRSAHHGTGECCRCIESRSADGRYRFIFDREWTMWVWIDSGGADAEVVVGGSIGREIRDAARCRYGGNGPLILNLRCRYVSNALDRGYMSGELLLLLLLLTDERLTSFKTHLRCRYGSMAGERRRWWAYRWTRYAVAVAGTCRPRVAGAVTAAGTDESTERWYVVVAVTAALTVRSSFQHLQIRI